MRGLHGMTAIGGCGWWVESGDLDSGDDDDVLACYECRQEIEP